jgi:hypothetical protein
MQLDRPEPIFCIAEIGILNCSTCRKPMRLTRIEPFKEGYDMRTFECSKCDIGKSLLVTI